MTTTQAVPQSQEVTHASTPLQGFSSGSATAASFFRDTIPKLLSSIKSQNQVPSFVVILLAVVILLMQVCYTTFLREVYYLLNKSRDHE